MNTDPSPSLILPAVLSFLSRNLISFGFWSWLTIGRPSITYLSVSIRAHILSQ
jgi:uncharacterized membrane protein YjgN (DUF898 family)